MLKECRGKSKHGQRDHVTNIKTAFSSMQYLYDLILVLKMMTAGICHTEVSPLNQNKQIGLCNYNVHFHFRCSHSQKRNYANKELWTFL